MWLGRGVGMEAIALCAQHTPLFPFSRSSPCPSGPQLGQRCQRALHHTTFPRYRDWSRDSGCPRPANQSPSPRAAGRRHAFHGGDKLTVTVFLTMLRKPVCRRKWSHHTRQATMRGKQKRHDGSYWGFWRPWFRSLRSPELGWFRQAFLH